MFGVAFSTVVGRLMMMGRPGPAFQARVAVLQASSATGSSVMLKVSGEYSSTHSVSGCASVSDLISPTWVSMSCITSGTLMPNTTRRHTGAVALYTCTMARRAPRRLSIVRRISSSRACVITISVTSSGTSPCSMRSRTV